MPTAYIKIDVEIIPCGDTKKLQEETAGHQVLGPISPADSDQIVDAVINAVRPQIANDIMQIIAQAIQRKTGEGKDEDKEIDSIFVLQKKLPTTPIK